MNLLLLLSLTIIIGLVVTLLLKKFKLPAVTCYLVAGVIFGPYCLGLLHIENLGFTSLYEVESFSVVSTAALGFIAFSIGNEFKLTSLKTIGKQAVTIGILQALSAAFLIDIALISLSIAFPTFLTISQAITLGAIGTATAPAATLMVVRQYNAKGKIVDLLLPIVALDDAVGLVVFSVSFGISKILALGQFSLVSILLNPVIEIIGSLVLGSIIGWLLNKATNLSENKMTKLSACVAFVLLGVGLSNFEFNFKEIEVGFSSLLVCMMIGTLFANLNKDCDEIMDSVDNWTSPLLVAFFVLSGSDLELTVLSKVNVIIIGVIYLITRSLGKYFGAYFSAKLTGCEKKICDHLGICLLPQAGVALGMCVQAMQLGEQGNLIRNITLLAVLIYELVGPLLCKRSLKIACDSMDD